MIKRQNLYTWQIISVVLLISAFFRFYKLEHLFFFSLDEEVIAFHVRRIVTSQHFPAIGVSAANTGLYLGPFFLYLAAPWFYLFNNQAIAGAWMASVIGVLATASIYWVGKEAFGEKVGLLASLLHAISLPTVLFERKFFNPSPAILVGSLVTMSLIKIERGDKRYLWLLAASLGMILHLNLSLIVYWLISVLWLIIKKVRLNVKDVGKIVLVLLFFMSPLIFFDIRHDFQLLRSFESLIVGKRSLEENVMPGRDLIGPIRFLAKVPAMRLSSNNILGEYATCPQAMKNDPTLFGSLLLVAVIVSLIKRRERKYLFKLALIIGIVGLWLYPGRVQEYYGMILVVPYLLLSSKTLVELSRNSFKYLWVLVVAGLLVFNLRQLQIIENPQGLVRKQELRDEIEMLTGGKPYYLTREGDECYGYGFLYMLQMTGNMPITSFEDPIVGWLYDEKEKVGNGNDGLVEIKIKSSVNKLDVERVGLN